MSWGAASMKATSEVADVILSDKAIRNDPAFRELILENKNLG
jgi:hypothetical protein